MQNVTPKAGPQPIACPLEDCAEPPWNGQIGEYCKGHKAWFDRQNGTGSTPIIQPDDPELLEREAKKAAANEAEEYRERRRVKTWRTLEDGRRIPEEYYTDEELAAIEAEAERMAEEATRRININTGMRMVEQTRRLEPGPRYDPVPQSDPVKEAAKLFKRALRGRYGKAAETSAWAFVAMLEER
jgi:hypothetical protein